MIYDYSENIKKLIEIYGLTDKSNEAGFILPDGRMINLKRNLENKIHHRDVLPFLNIEGDHYNLNHFLRNERIVRFCLNGVIHIENRPTEEQLSQLIKMIKYRAYPFELMCSNKIIKKEIKTKKELRDFFDIPYYGARVLTKENDNKIIFFNGIDYKPVAVYTKKNKNLIFKKRDLFFFDYLNNHNYLVLKEKIF